MYKNTSLTLIAITCLLCISTLILALRLWLSVLLAEAGLGTGAIDSIQMS
jgi:hypothetical protein